jgi:hypothetical protein
MPHATVVSGLFGGGSMRRLLSLFACLVAVGGSVIAGVSAHADDSDVDAAYCPATSVQGSGVWSPAETMTSAPHSFVWTTDAQCTGSGDESGPYHVQFTGSGVDNCVSGNGSGNLSGSGPEGTIAGTFTYRRIGIHLVITGDFVSGGEEHTLQYWLDVMTPSDQQACNYSTASLIGHGVIADWTLSSPPPSI